MNIASVFCVTWSPLKLAAHAHSSDSNIISVNAGRFYAGFIKSGQTNVRLLSQVFTHTV